MAIPRLNEDVEIISKLGDVPGSDDGLSTQQLKNKFDQAATLIKEYINNTLIPNVENTTPGLYSVTMNLTTTVLYTSGWSNEEQTVKVSGVLADSSKQAIITVAAPASLETYLDCNIRLTGQGEGTLTFACDDIPSTAVTVNVLILTNGG